MLRQRFFGTVLINRYMDRVIRAGQHDDAVALRFNEVVAMVRGPETLLTPRFMLRVLRSPRRATMTADARRRSPAGAVP